MRRGVYRRRYARHLPLEGAVGQRIERHVHAHALLDIRIERLRHVDHDLHGTYLLDDEDGIRTDHVAVVVVARRHHARNGRAESRVLQKVVVVRLRQLVFVLGLLPCGLRLAAELVEFVRALECRLVGRQLRLGLRQTRLVHFGHDLSRRDMVSHIDQKARDASRRLGGYVIDCISLDIAGEYADLVHFLDVHHLGGHFRLLLNGRLLDIAALRSAGYARHASTASKQCHDNITLHIQLLSFVFVLFPIIHSHRLPRASHRSPESSRARPD